METEETIGKQNPLEQSVVKTDSYTAALQWQISASITKRMKQKSTETLLDTKMESRKLGVKRFFDILDADIDEVTRTKLLEANGRAWYQHLHTKLEEVIERRELSYGWEYRFLNFDQNKHDCRELDCYCLCPMVEEESMRLSGDFCQCSIGYIRQMFLAHTGMKPEVELLESLKRGGKSCRFKITLT
ncbi:MAG: DUF6144 family protein [Bacteroidota bacterium]